MKFFRLLAALTIAVIPVLAGNEVASEKPASGDLAGTWHVTYTNGAVRTYLVGPDDTVKFLEENRQASIQRDREILVQFEDGKSECWTLGVERLFVEHWNPAAGYPDGSPTEIGIGVRDAGRQACRHGNAAGGVTDGLVGYWSFDSGDARDDSGNGHDGDVAGCTAVNDLSGRWKAAHYRFDGRHGHIAVPHDDAFNFGNGAFTLACWVKTTAETVTGDLRDDLVTKGDATIRGFSLSLVENHLAFIFGWQQGYFGTTPVNDGEWHHLAAMRTPEGKVFLYLDGKPEPIGRTGWGRNVDRAGTDDVTTQDPLLIGKHGCLQVSFFTGELDEVRIYDRALSESEVMGLSDRTGVARQTRARFGTSGGSDRQSAALRCVHPYKMGSFIGFFSFETGELPVVRDPGQVDLVYYFDGDDCSQGAIIGRDDRPGYLFPIGHKSWEELVKLAPPSDASESVAAIAPLSRDKEGLAFWVKRKSGEYVLARIKTVEPASYSDLKSGVVPTLELEWFRRGTGDGE
jgi:Concanavalin A-like lectin/glucanases superfamily